MSVGVPYKHNPIQGDYDAIVIGSGIGGLTAAALLSRHAHKRVLVLERHYAAGGFTHTFRRPGYEWDVGVHYIGEVHRPNSVLRRLFDHLTDGALEWADMGEVYDTIVIGDDRYELVRGRERFRDRMVEYFPDAGEAIDRYLTLVQDAARRARTFFAEKALPATVAKLVGPVMRYPLLRIAKRTTLEVLRELTSDERLIGVLTGQYGDYGLPPAESSFFMHALLVRHYLGGGAYPIGGSGRIAATIEPSITAAGGVIVTRAEVDQIIVERDRAVGVRLADGVEVRSPIIISDAGVALTLGRLLPTEAAASHGLKPTLAGAATSVSHLCLYLGLRHTAAELGLATSNLWVYPHHDHDRNVARFLADPEAPLPVTYLSFPSAKDPDFERRFPGRSTIEAITLAPYDWFRPWEGTRMMKRGADYESLKAGLQDRLLEQLYAQYPVVRGKIDHAELSTPLSTRHFAAHPQGEIYGLSHTPARFQARWLRPQTRLPGLFLTGADISTAGVGGALVGGVLTASAILRRNLMEAAMSSPRSG